MPFESMPIKMPFNRMLVSFGAAMLGLTMAGAANAAVIGDVGLGFGKFLGTWVNEGNPSDGIPRTMPNPTVNSASVEEVGLAILFRYPGSFPIEEFNLAGAIDEYGGDHTNSTDAGEGFRIELDSNEHTARWDYYGFPPPAIPDVSPGMEPTELYVAVKYGGYTSVFLYDVVDPNMAGGAYGYVTSDYQNILDTITDAGVRTDLNYNGFDGTPDDEGNNVPCTWDKNKGVITPEFSDTCMGDRHGISHVVGYWPPIDNVDVPEPASMTLLGAGLLGLGYIRRRRQAS